MEKFTGRHIRPSSYLLLIGVQLILLQTAECYVGKFCTSNSNCYADGERCVHSTCTCAKLKYQTYSLHPECDTSPPVCTSDHTCSGNNSVCRDGSCECSSGYLKIGSTCKLAKMQNLMDPCYESYGSDNVLACDISKHRLCRSRKCICFDNYYANFSTGICESKDTYMRTNNLTEYKVMPGLYCRTASNCITGLECKDYRCSCPGDCEYKADKQVCDCGPLGVALGPLITGIIVGFLILLFWGCIIRRTIKSHKSNMKKKEKFSDVSSSPAESRRCSSYALSPLQSEPPTADISQPTEPLQAKADALSPQTTPYPLLDPLQPNAGSHSAQPFNPESVPLISTAPPAQDFPSMAEDSTKPSAPIGFAMPANPPNTDSSSPSDLPYSTNMYQTSYPNSPSLVPAQPYPPSSDTAQRPYPSSPSSQVPYSINPSETRLPSAP